MHGCYHVQPEAHVQGLKVSDFPDGKLTIRGIFQHNRNWDRYEATHGDTLRGVEVEEVRKLLTCHDPKRGMTCVCPKCATVHTVTFGCNSRLCSGCGKPHADRWAADLGKTILPVPHRHLTFTMAEQLWPLVRKYPVLWKVVMDAVIMTLEEVLGPMVRGRGPKRSGAIVVLHPFGRDLRFKPHAHVICPEGVFDGDTWVPRTFFPMGAFRKVSQYYLLTGFREALKQAGVVDAEAEELVDRMFSEFPEGFVVHVTAETRIKDSDKVIRYVGRYVRHPAIGQSRLVGYDGKRVTFQYEDHATGDLMLRTLSVEEFIEALLQHVPERQFKMIRYYGVYSRGLKGHFRGVLGLCSLAQSKLGMFGVGRERRREFRCPKCGRVMDVVLYDRPPPAKEAVGGPMGSNLDDYGFLPGSPG